MEFERENEWNYISFFLPKGIFRIDIYRCEAALWQIMEVFFIGWSLLKKMASNLM